jgi:hypothetical protein
MVRQGNLTVPKLEWVRVHRVLAELTVLVLVQGPDESWRPTPYVRTYIYTYTHNREVPLPGYSQGNLD